MKLRIGIDAAGHCPLTCPSCPQGRREITRPSNQSLTASKLAGMMDVISRQDVEIVRLALFTYTEPLLNADLPELVEVANHYSQAEVSTSGDRYVCDLKDLARSQPRIVVTLSGMSQETHGLTRVGGRLNASLAFLRTVKGFGARDVFILYHRYRHTLREERDARRFAKDLGITFRCVWGTQLGIESLIKGESHPYQMVPTSRQLEVAKSESGYKCTFQTGQLDIDSLGNVRACGVAADHSPIGNVFHNTIQQLLERKRRYELCSSCYASSAYKIACSMSIGVDKEYARVAQGGLMDRLRWAFERAKKRVWVRLEHPRNDTGKYDTWADAPRAVLERNR